MGCGVNCPAIKIDQDWGLDDPHGKPLSAFEDCADKIEENIRRLDRVREPDSNLGSGVGNA